MSLLNIPLRKNPSFSSQMRRTKPTKSNIKQEEILGFDTETIDGKVWLLTHGKMDGTFEAIYPKTFLDVCVAFINSGSVDRSRKKKDGTAKCDRWIYPKFFAWNQQYDFQAIIKLLPDETIAAVISRGTHGTDIKPSGELLDPKGKMTKADIKKVDRYIQISYIEKKYTTIKLMGSGWNDPILSRKLFSKKPPGAPFRKVKIYDMLQLYKKSLKGKSDSLKNHGENIGMNKLGDTVDVELSGKGTPEGEKYRKDNQIEIEKYGLMDAEITQVLSRKKLKELTDSGVRPINPISTASIAEVNLLDMAYDQTIIPFFRKGNKVGLDWLAWGRTAYRGGWFEAAEIGKIDNCAVLDLVSAYPAAMWHLESMTHYVTDPKTGKKNQRLCGKLISGEGQESWEAELATDTRPCRLGFVEVVVEFTKIEGAGIQYPIGVYQDSSNSQSCIVFPRCAKAIITYPEYVEMKKHKIDHLIVGSWKMFKSFTPSYPFRKFIGHHFEIKENKNNKQGMINSAKICLNSVYGKMVQINPGNEDLEINEKAGGLYQPIYAAIITGQVRAQMAEISRVNNYKVILNATDGVIVDLGSSNLSTEVIVPTTPPCIGKLGEWDVECGSAEAIIMMNGVYSWQSHAKDSNGIPIKSKTTTRGATPTFVAQTYGDYNWFKICDNYSDEEELTTTRSSPLSLKQARVKKDFSQINIFTEQEYILTPVGSSNKRVYPSDDKLPKTFGALAKKRYQLMSHERVY